MRQGQLPLNVATSDHPELRSQLGAVYTPALLADWVAELLMDSLPEEARATGVLDPACGDGSLLRAIQRQDETIPLVGFDIDPTAVRRTQQALPSAACHHLDALIDQWPDDWDVAGVIVNPPWGADLGHSRTALQAAGYTLASGQFDSYELFLERIIEELADGTVVAAILPDSVFLPEHEALRRLLVKRTTLLKMARLGEGFFEDVYRGTVVLLLRVGPPPKRHTVSCYRLRKGDRKAVLNGRRSLSDVFNGSPNRIAQSRFAQAPGVRFDIDVRRDDRSAVSKFEDKPSDWNAWYTFSRGVELGKVGLVSRCACGIHRPSPRNTHFTCSACGELVDTAASQRSIIRPSNSVTTDDGMRPIVVGEDVDRYSLSIRRVIQADLPGINYKRPSLYAGQKLFVRKTGLGIKATIDTTGAWTNQVVYLVRARQHAPDFALPYALGVLSSRCMLAYYLSTTGETEWRSHPYITPKVIKTLPLPMPSTANSATAEQARRIASAVRKILDEGYTVDTDLEVESLVAGLFGLDATDLDWVKKTLERADDLQAIASMRFPAEIRLVPSHVGDN
jgi:adenine-specific DNA-methyltransferase